MMKIAVFSDIHGNYKALEAVMNMIAKEKADRIIFLGDIFQKGNEEIKCLEFLMNSDIICVKGNCELYLEKGVEIDSDVKQMKDYYDNMREQLTPEQIEFVHSLPLGCEIRINGKSILFSHFLIKDKSATYPFYQLSDINTKTFSDAVSKMNEYDLVAVGHTHRNFSENNVVGVSAAGIGKPTFMLIDTNEKFLYRYISEE